MASVAASGNRDVGSPPTAPVTYMSPPATELLTPKQAAQIMGDSFIKLTLNGSSLSVTDYFTPFNQQTLSDEDSDLGSSGLVLLPDQAGVHPHLGISAGKEGKTYLVNRDTLASAMNAIHHQII